MQPWCEPSRSWLAVTSYGGHASRPRAPISRHQVGSCSGKPMIIFLTGLIYQPPVSSLDFRDAIPLSLNQHSLLDQTIMDASSQDNVNNGTQPTLRGSCLCAACSYTVSGPPIQAIICHCNNCKKWGGGAFAANVWIPSAFFKLDDASASHINVYTDSNTDTGRAMNRVSCKKCGSSLYVDIPYFEVVSVTRGTLDGVESLEGLDPVVEFYCCRQLPWAEVASKTDRRQKLE